VVTRLPVMLELRKVIAPLAPTTPDLWESLAITPKSPDWFIVIRTPSKMVSRIDCPATFWIRTP